MVERIKMTITQVYYFQIPAHDLFLIWLNENQKVIILFLCYSIQKLFCNTYWSMFIIINDFINLMINKIIDFINLMIKPKSYRKQYLNGCHPNF